MSAMLMCIGLAGHFMWSVARGFREMAASNAAAAQARATTCYVDISNQHAQAVSDIRLYAVRNGQLGELLAEHHGLHAGTSTLFAVDTSNAPFTVRVQYEGSDGSVVLDDVVNVDGDSNETTTVRLGVEDDRR